VADSPHASFCLGTDAELAVDALHIGLYCAMYDNGVGSPGEDGGAFMEAMGGIGATSKLGTAGPGGHGSAQDDNGDNGFQSGGGGGGGGGAGYIVVVGNYKGSPITSPQITQPYQLK